MKREPIQADFIGGGPLSPAAAGRGAAIEQIVRRVIDERRHGRSVDYPALERQHPELMPELGERLRRLRAVELAAERDGRLDSGPFEPGDELDFREEAQFLAEHLRGYEILEHIHYGGQGVVFRAIQKSTNRAVAIKLLLDGPLATKRQQHRFSREVELVSRIRHPNIVTVHDSGVIHRRHFLVMEYVDGLPIDDYVLLHSLGAREIVALFRDVCYAVSAAHQHGIIHRDLKPTNILVDADGQVHVLDFGLAKDLSDDASMESISIPGRVVGTLPYLSPEQAAASGDLLDIRSDVYSLGIVLYQLITGSFPYSVEGEMRHVLENIQSRPARSLRAALGEDCPDWIRGPQEIPDDLERIVLKALEKDKAFRYQSAAAFGDDLGRFLAGDAVEAKAASRLYMLKKTVRRFRIHFSIAACFLLLLIGSLVAVTAAWQRTKRVARIAQTGLQMGAFVRLGSVERDAGRIDQGIAMFEKALEIGDQVQTDDPNVLEQRYGAHHRLADLYFESGAHANGRPHLASAIAIATAMAERMPGDPEWRRQLAFSRLLQGRICLAEKRWEEGVQHFDAAEGIFRDFLEADPDSETHREDLTAPLLHKATAGQHLGRLDDTMRWLKEAYVIVGELAEQKPDYVNYAFDLASTEAKIGVCHLYYRSPAHDEKALEWLNRADGTLSKIEDAARRAGLHRDVDRVRDVIGQNRRLASSRLSARG